MYAFHNSANSDTITSEIPEFSDDYLKFLEDENQSRFASDFFNSHNPGILQID